MMVMMMGENQDEDDVNYVITIMITLNLGGLTALALPAAWTTER